MPGHQARNPGANHLHDRLGDEGANHHVPGARSVDTGRLGGHQGTHQQRVNPGDRHLEGLPGGTRSAECPKCLGDGRPRRSVKARVTMVRGHSRGDAGHAGLVGRQTGRLKQALRHDDRRNQGHQVGQGPDASHSDHIATQPGGENDNDRQQQRPSNLLNHGLGPHHLVTAGGTHQHRFDHGEWKQRRQRREHPCQLGHARAVGEQVGQPRRLCPHQPGEQQADAHHRHQADGHHLGDDVHRVHGAQAGDPTDQPRCRPQLGDTSQDVERGDGHQRHTGGLRTKFMVEHPQERKVGSAVHHGGHQVERAAACHPAEGARLPIWEMTATAALVQIRLHLDMDLAEYGLHAWRGLRTRVARFVPHHRRREQCRIGTGAERHVHLKFTRRRPPHRSPPPAAALAQFTSSSHNTGRSPSASRWPGAPARAASINLAASSKT